MLCDIRIFMHRLHIFRNCAESQDVNVNIIVVYDL